MTKRIFFNRSLSLRTMSGLAFAGAVLAPVVFSNPAQAQALGYATAAPRQFPQDYATAPSQDGSVVPERLRRATVNLDTREASGTVIIDTGHTVLYYVLGGGRAIRYGVGV